MSITDSVARVFASDIEGHEKTVVKDDGVFRHVQFRNPKHGMYWFDLTTVPGTLFFQGDMGAFTFRRLTDMFEFFAGSAERKTPNLDYWAQKVTSGNGTIRRYSEKKLRQHIKDAVEEAADEFPGLADAVENDVLLNLEGHEHYDRDLVDEFRYWVDSDSKEANPNRPDFEFSDHFEWDCRDFTYQFVWACHAILWGISVYRGQEPILPPIPEDDETTARPAPRTFPPGSPQPGDRVRGVSATGSTYEGVLLRYREDAQHALIRDDIDMIRKVERAAVEVIEPAPATTPDLVGQEIGSLPDEVVNAIVRDPDDPRYPAAITVYCDRCHVEHQSSYIVHDELTRAERLARARAHMRTLGWSCDTAGDHCPNCRPTDTGKEIDPRSPTAGVDYCGATHPDYGECFLDVDKEEHVHGHESETGRWPVNDAGASRDA